MKKRISSGFFLAAAAFAAGLGDQAVVWSAPDDREQQEIRHGDSHIWENLNALLKDSWKDIAGFVGETVSMALLAGVSLFVAGAILGAVTCVMLYRRSLFDARFDWNRYVQWIWFPLFSLSFALGFSCAGVFLGAGHAVKHSILEERIIDRTIASLYCALALDAADYQLHGQETLEDIEAVLTQSELLADIVATDIGQLTRQIIREDAGQGNLTQQHIWALESVSDSRLGKMVVRDIMQEPDPRLIVLALYDFGQTGVASRKFQQAHPEANPVVAALTEYFQIIRKELCALVDSFVYTNACLAVLTGIGTPVLLLLIFRTGIRRFPTDSTVTMQERAASQ